MTKITEIDIHVPGLEQFGDLVQINRQITVNGQKPSYDTWLLKRDDIPKSLAFVRAGYKVYAHLNFQWQISINGVALMQSKGWQDVPEFKPRA